MTSVQEEHQFIEYCWSLQLKGRIALEEKFPLLVLPKYFNIQNNSLRLNRFSNVSNRIEQINALAPINSKSSN